MEPKKLSSSMTVSPQISASDVKMIKALGYTVIVCNRPDNETEDQVNFDVIKRIANTEEIDAIYQPVIAGKISSTDITTFKSILEKASGPVFAYCRTGNRSETLWSKATSHENQG